MHHSVRVSQKQNKHCIHLCGLHDKVSVFSLTVFIPSSLTELWGLHLDHQTQQTHLRKDICYGCISVTTAILWQMWAVVVLGLCMKLNSFFMCNKTALYLRCSRTNALLTFHLHLDNERRRRSSSHFHNKTPECFKLWCLKTCTLHSGIWQSLFQGS